jgi:HPt (histidine-containing phosphotransfer) domain-containing protein
MPALKTQFFDYELTLERIGGDPDLFAEIAKLFLDFAPTSLDAIRSAVVAGDARGVELASHKLKGAVCNFGLGQAYETANLLEHMAREQNLSGAQDVFKALESALDALSRELVELLVQHMEVSSAARGL